jgi:hypothetical protein
MKVKTYSPPERPDPLKSNARIAMFNGNKHFNASNALKRQPALPIYLPIE